jgi:hypothetical protein
MVTSPDMGGQKAMRAADCARVQSAEVCSKRGGRFMKGVECRNACVVKSLLILSGP